MAEKLGVYKCGICGNVVEVLRECAGELVCCGEPMELLKEQTSGVGQEKHVPVVEKTKNGFKVKVGLVPHPMMEEKHFIEWIELTAGARICRKQLKPGDAPEAVFEVEAESVEARAYCNVHGLWKNEG